MACSVSNFLTSYTTLYCSTSLFGHRRHGHDCFSENLYFTDSYFKQLAELYIARTVDTSQRTK